MDKDHLAFCKVQWKKGLAFAKYQHNSNHMISWGYLKNFNQAAV